jgi:hypothetical protein
MRKPTPRHLTRLEDDRSRFEQKTERFFRLFVDATFTTVHGVGSDVEIPHKAGVIPSAAIPAFPSADARIWKGDTEWTQKYIYLQASAACTSTIFLVI